MHFTLAPKAVLKTLLWIIFVLAVLHIAQFSLIFIINDFDVFEGVRMFDFDYEKNFPSLYSALAILFCAMILSCISVFKRREDAPFKNHWFFLAIIFVYLGCDEALALHEEVGDLVEDYGLVKAEGFLFFAWVVPYAILMLLFALSYMRFVFALPRKTMLLFIASGTLFLSGAFGFEIFSARQADIEGFDTIGYYVLYTLEELCEMIGIALFCYALLDYLQSEFGELRFQLGGER